MIFVRARKFLEIAHRVREGLRHGHSYDADAFVTSAAGRMMIIRAAKLRDMAECADIVNDVDRCHGLDAPHPSKRGGVRVTIATRSLRRFEVFVAESGDHIAGMVALSPDNTGQCALCAPRPSRHRASARLLLDRAKTRGDGPGRTLDVRRQPRRASILPAGRVQRKSGGRMAITKRSCRTFSTAGSADGAESKAVNFIRNSVIPVGYCSPRHSRALVWVRRHPQCAVRTGSGGTGGDDDIDRTADRQHA